MNGFVGLGLRLLLAALAPLLMIIQPSGVDARAREPPSQKAQVTKPQVAKPQVAKPLVTMNAWTVGIAGGLLEGAPIRLAAEIARVVDDGNNLHSAGGHTWRHGKRELAALFDAAIINSDVT